jgi:hypothetical protein
MGTGAEVGGKSARPRQRRLFPPFTGESTLTCIPALIGQSITLGGASNAEHGSAPGRLTDRTRTSSIQREGLAPATRAARLDGRHP